RGRLDRYYGTAEIPEFNMVFDFDFAGKLGAAVRFQNPEFARFAEKDMFAPGNPVRYATFLSNHDNVANRPASVYKTREELRLASAIPLLLPATPFIYYGNEIGQPDQPGLSGQDLRLRYPFDWKLADTQKADHDSLLAMHRTLLGLRAAHPALRIGSYTAVPVQASDVKTTYAYLLQSQGDAVLCVFNLGGEAVPSLMVETGGLVSGSGGEPAEAELLYASSASIAPLFADGGVTISGMASRDFAVFALK
ncbi:MAG TPA: alpha-amylase family glycosyl hydrolase, partial [Treponemataceae bacterium]|nr:alpha-amylase family glycosyl hydrolase [Treponemataceae bacterium]